MTRQIRPLRSSSAVLLLALLVPACDATEQTTDTDTSVDTDDTNDTDDIDDTDDTDGSEPNAALRSTHADIMAAPLPTSRAELDALADRGLIQRSTPRSLAQADRSQAERLRAAELRIAAAAAREPGRRLDAIIAPAQNVERTEDGNYRVKIADAVLGEREVITMGPTSTTLDLAAALEALDNPANQLAAYRALHERIAPARHARLGVVSPDALRSASATEIRAEIERLAAHPDLLGSLDSLAISPASHEPSLPTADNTDSSCNPSPTAGVVANFSFPLKPNLSTIKNQGNRGSCTAFAVTSAVETARSVGGNGLPNYSEQDLYYRAKAEWSGLSNYGDGLNVSSTLDLALSNSYHFATEGSWPYNPSYSRIDPKGLNIYLNSCTGYNFSFGGLISNYCSETAHQGGQFCVANTCFYSSPVGTGTGSRISSSFDIPMTIPVVRAYLAAKYSLVMSFSVTNSFKNPTAGGYVNSFFIEPVLGTHAIHLVGLIDNAQLATVRPGAPAGDGGGYVILKNSWGSCFADGGYVYMSYNSFNLFAYAIRGALVAN